MTSAASDVLVVELLKHEACRKVLSSCTHARPWTLIQATQPWDTVSHLQDICLGAIVMQLDSWPPLSCR